MACGASLAHVCPACGAEAPAQARFCMSCGTALDGAPAPATREEQAAPSEERRTVTVLFADLSGYTSVSEQLDHETVKALAERCLTRLSAEVERFGGHVDKYIGDNVMALFGAPIAHEDDPERAVRAALGMQAAMAELNQGIGLEFGFELPLRIGINTGEVLAGRVGKAYTVVGQAGVGKTRILHELEERLAQHEMRVRVLRGRCLPFGSSAVYWPLTEMLRTECAILDGDSGSQAASKLNARLGPVLAEVEGEEHLERRLAPLARLLGAEIAGEVEGGEAEDGQSARESFFGAVRAVP